VKLTVTIQPDGTRDARIIMDDGRTYDLKRVEWRMVERADDEAIEVSSAGGEVFTLPTHEPDPTIELELSGRFVAMSWDSNPS
jgi:hypothetical protein